MIAYRRKKRSVSYPIRIHTARAWTSAVYDPGR